MKAVALGPALAIVAGAACGVASSWGTGLDGQPTFALWGLIVAIAGAATAYLRHRGLVFVACAAAAFFCGGSMLAADAKQKALETPLRAVLEREFGGFDIDSPGPGGGH